jgi:beta-lactamase regulating signal transducer with metallopeptidase domain
MAWWLFQNIVVTAALVAAVAVVCRFCRIGPVARHALWVLVLVKFVTPPILVWPWAAPDPLGLASDSRHLAIEERAVIGQAAERDSRDREGARALTATTVDVATTLSNSASTTDRGTTAWSVLLALWIAGSLGLLGIESVRLVRLTRRVRSARPADRAISNRVAELSAQLGLRRTLRVLELPGSTSPVVWCVGRPVLLWPAALPADATDACIDGLLVHELAHIERRDHLVGWIELVAGVVWWWNPLFWFVRSALREQAELACDAWVISALPNGRRAYAESLLTLSSIAGPRPMSKSMAAVIGVRASSRRVLERRLVMIMKGRAPLRLPSVGVFTLVVIAAATLPAWATSDQQSQATQQPQSAAQAQPSQPTQPQAQPQPRQAQAQQGQRRQEQAQASQAQQGQRQQSQPQPAQSTRTTQPRARAATPQPHQMAMPTRADDTNRPTTHQSVPPASATNAEPAQGRRATTPATAQADPTWHIAAQNGRARFAYFDEHLPEDAQNAVKKFQTDREAIEREIDAKVQARKETLTKELQALQEQYTKAGKLDEAIAIRDYLKAGGPFSGSWYQAYIRR